VLGFVAVTASTINVVSGSSSRSHVEDVQEARRGETLMDLFIQTSYLIARAFILSLNDERPHGARVLAAKWVCAGDHRDAAAECQLSMDHVAFLLGSAVGVRWRT